MLPGPKKPYSPLEVQEKRQKFFQTKQNEIDRSFASAQKQQDTAIDRRMASLGQSNSGAAIGLHIDGRSALEAQKTQSRSALIGQHAQEESQHLLSNELLNKDRDFKRDLFNVEQGNKLRELDLAERQFLEDKETTEFNKRMAMIMANQEDPGLLGMGGVLGSGLNGPQFVGSVVTGGPGAVITAGTGKKYIRSGK